MNIVGSNPIRHSQASLAQWLELGALNSQAAGSNPARGTTQTRRNMPSAAVVVEGQNVLVHEEDVIGGPLEEGQYIDLFDLKAGGTWVGVVKGYNSKTREFTVAHCRPR